MGGRILPSPIEMVSHPYNSAALPRSLWLFWAAILVVPSLLGDYLVINSGLVLGELFRG